MVLVVLQKKFPYTHQGSCNLSKSVIEFIYFHCLFPCHAGNYIPAEYFSLYLLPLPSIHFFRIQECREPGMRSNYRKRGWKHSRMLNIFSKEMYISIAWISTLFFVLFANYCVIRLHFMAFFPLFINLDHHNRCSTYSSRAAQHTTVSALSYRWELWTIKYH